MPYVSYPLALRKLKNNEPLDDAEREVLAAAISTYEQKIGRLENLIPPLFDSSINTEETALLEKIVLGLMTAAQVHLGPNLIVTSDYVRAVCSKLSLSKVELSEKEVFNTALRFPLGAIDATIACPGFCWTICTHPRDYCSFAEVENNKHWHLDPWPTPTSPILTEAAVSTSTTAFISGARRPDGGRKQHKIPINTRALNMVLSSYIKGLHKDTK